MKSGDRVTRMGGIGRKTREELRDFLRAPLEILDRKDSTRKKRNPAKFDMIHLFKAMALSTIFITLAVVFFEVLLYLHSGGWGDLDTHLVNMADNVFAFVVGLMAMDGLIFYNRARQMSRAETRAIIRHNRIVRPAMDMYLARLNRLIASPDKEVGDPFREDTPFTIRDLKDMYGESGIPSDAGERKIDAFSFHMEKLNTALVKMVQDIDFAGNPEICDAALRFINDTTYGRSALQALRSYGMEGTRSARNTVIRQIKAEPLNGTLRDAKPELKNVYVLMNMIEGHQSAIQGYHEAVSKVYDWDAEKEYVDEYGEYARGRNTISTGKPRVSESSDTSQS